MHRLVLLPVVSVALRRVLALVLLQDLEHVVVAEVQRLVHGRVVPPGRAATGRGVRHLRARGQGRAVPAQPCDQQPPEGACGSKSGLGGSLGARGGGGQYVGASGGEVLVLADTGDS